MTNMIFYVYTHCRKDNGEVFYVGSAGEKEYKNPSKKYKRANDLRSNRRTKEWNVINIDAGGSLVKIICLCETDEQARQRELELIIEYGIDSLANQRLQTISWGENKRKNNGRAGSKHHAFGKRASDETKDKKSKALSGEKHHLFGKQLPQEWKDNIAKGKLGNKNPWYGKKTPIARKVIDTETGKEYGSVSDAADSIGLNMKTLYNKLSGHRKNNTSLRFA